MKHCTVDEVIGTARWFYTCKNCGNHGEAIWDVGNYCHVCDKRMYVLRFAVGSFPVQDERRK